MEEDSKEEKTKEGFKNEVIKETKNVKAKKKKKLMEDKREEK